MGRKYAALAAYLERQLVDEFSISFADIEKILDFPLPPSARTHDPWWSNSRSPGRHNEAWLGVGWEVADRNMTAQTISFRRFDTSRSIRSIPPASNSRAVGREFDRATLTETDLAADFTLTLQLRWRRLGAVVLDIDRKLVLPAAPVVAGLYRFIVRSGTHATVYVGEAVNLKRRFGHYRLPGNTQQTNLRINALLTEVLDAGGAAALDIAYEDIGLNIGGEFIEADLANKAVRRMVEHAAIVAHGGTDVEILNR